MLQYTFPQGIHNTVILQKGDEVIQVSNVTALQVTTSMEVTTTSTPVTHKTLKNRMCPSASSDDTLMSYTLRNYLDELYFNLMAFAAREVNQLGMLHRNDSHQTILDTLFMHIQQTTAWTAFDCVDFLYGYNQANIPTVRSELKCKDKASNLWKALEDLYGDVMDYVREQMILDLLVHQNPMYQSTDLKDDEQVLLDYLQSLNEHNDVEAFVRWFVGHEYVMYHR